MDLPGRNIDRDRNGFVPRGGFTTGRSQHPFADLENEAGLFGQGYERVRQHLAARRMRPAQQRFKPDHLAVANILLRLIDEV
jgi:hypothetical protein